MVRKLKVYQTSLGFFDLVIAAPSMKAALEAWGANTNLFHQGFAKEAGDPRIVAAALASPGVVLRRPVGSNKPFKEEAELPTNLAGEASRSVDGIESKAAKARPGNGKVERERARAFEIERKRRERERQKEAAAEAKRRERREQAIESASAALEEAEREHVDRVASIEAEREAVDKRAQAEEHRWRMQKEKLEALLQRARGE